MKTFVFFESEPATRHAPGQRFKQGAMIVKTIFVLAFLFFGLTIWLLLFAFPWWLSLMSAVVGAALLVGWIACTFCVQNK